ncbi:probable transcription regulator Cj0480c [Campylobacter upsaliensis RM3195]|nr:probable transcription regulator Cj0480c [Campylobacter upsaliensis RM3195]
MNLKKLYPQAFKKMTEKTLNNIEELHTELKK